MAHRPLEGCDLCVKFTFMAFNVFLALVGVVIIVLSVIAHVKFTDFTGFFGTFSTAIVLIVIGCLTLLISFLGFLGAHKESLGAMQTYTVMLIIILVLDIIFLYMIYIGSVSFIFGVDSSLADAMNRYNQTGEGDVTQSWDSVQQSFKCCGSTDYTGWKTILDGDVPDSCCRTVTRACGHGAAAKEQSVVTAKIYTQGCATPVGSYLGANLMLLAGVGIGIIAIQVMGIVKAGCLVQLLRTPVEYHGIR